METGLTQSHLFGDLAIPFSQDDFTGALSGVGAAQPPGAAEIGSSVPQTAFLLRSGAGRAAFLSLTCFYKLGERIDA
jgi:hypothetical protein